MKSYRAQWGELQDADRDLIEVLKFCHYAEIEGGSAAELIDSITTYIETAFTPEAVSFDEPEADDEE
ncbi:hypothetical protein Q9S78_11950 [Microbacterium sp. KSW-18]|uniref:Uncharacterized protein n=1 Tax=Microbacterium aquilitoris TaxID=3067307 RepID=A0ABU3GNB2_9MICO|nr:hypothetical protein [Microbacterium sp. KSW-18]MDT3331381.1 hypothetical protein [Microbacterium sp. KSW-18]